MITISTAPQRCLGKIKLFLFLVLSVFEVLSAKVLQILLSGRFEWPPWEEET